MLSDKGVVREKTINVNQDNLRAISWTENIRVLKNVKHVAICDLVDKACFAVIYTPSAETLVDLFTEALLGEHFERLRTATNVELKTYLR